MLERLQHNDPMIELDEPAEIGWRNMLAEFDEQVWPIYEKHGYSKDTGLLVWTLNRVHSRLLEIAETLEERTL